MNINQAHELLALARFEERWENANPYDDKCDEERCVRKNCSECNKEKDDD